MGTSALAAYRTWYIAGATHGPGRAFAETALHGGDRVAAAARDFSPPEKLAARHPGRLPALALDVTDRAAVFDVVAQVVQHLGRLAPRAWSRPTPSWTWSRNTALSDRRRSQQLGRVDLDTDRVG